MREEIKSKVIRLFEHHRRMEPPEGFEPVGAEMEEGGELIVTPDGFHYVSLKQDGHGMHSEASLREVADKKHYMIKMLEAHSEPDALRLNSYYVPGERLEAFLLSLSQRPGKVLEIQQFIPDGMA